jgi:hypothetical protein
MTSDNGHKVLQGLAGLAASCGLGCLVLQAQQKISERGLVRHYKSTSPLIGVCSSQHRIGTWAPKFSFVCSICVYLSRFIERNRNAYHHCGQAFLGFARGIDGCAGCVRRVRQNVTVANTLHPGQNMISLFAIRYSLFAPLRSAHV